MKVALARKCKWNEGQETGGFSTSGGVCRGERRRPQTPAVQTRSLGGVSTAGPAVRNRGVTAASSRGPFRACRPRWVPLPCSPGAPVTSQARVTRAAAGPALPSLPSVTLRRAGDVPTGPCETRGAQPDPGTR